MQEKKKEKPKSKPSNTEEFSKVKSDACVSVMKHSDGRIEERKF